MSVRRRSLRVRAGILLAATLMASCGGGDICLQCPSGTPTPGPAAAIVTGTITSINPAQTPANVTVVICVDLPAGGTANDCTQSFFTDVTTQGDFVRNNVKAGSETIFFWVDANNDGTIDPGDPLAVLTDSQGKLDLVQAGQTVTLANVSITFPADSVGTATADITVANTPTPTPTAFSPTPTPQPT